MSNTDHGLPGICAATFDVALAAEALPAVLMHAAGDRDSTEAVAVFDSLTGAVDDQLMLLSLADGLISKYDLPGFLETCSRFKDHVERSRRWLHEDLARRDGESADTWEKRLRQWHRPVTSDDEQRPDGSAVSMAELQGLIEERASSGIRTTPRDLMCCLSSDDTEAARLFEEACHDMLDYLIQTRGVIGLSMLLAKHSGQILAHAITQIGADQAGSMADCIAVVKEIAGQFIPRHQAIDEEIAAFAPTIEGPNLNAQAIRGFASRLSEALRPLRIQYDLTHCSPSALEEEIQLAGKHRWSAILFGEPGAGKGYYAAQLARVSNETAGVEMDNENPLGDNHINCATLQENLAQSELFGHKKGSYTDAIEARKGAIETAGKSALFLDEVGELSHALQAQLLMAMREKKYRSLGVDQNRSVECHFIFATNRKADALRADFLGRIPSKINIPPLRKRKGEMMALIAKLLQLINSRNKEATPKLVGERRMKDDEKHNLAQHEYPWPGNVAELYDALDRAAASAKRTKTKKRDPSVNETGRLHITADDVIIAALEQAGDLDARTRFYEAADLRSNG